MIKQVIINIIVVTAIILNNVCFPHARELYDGQTTVMLNQTRTAGGQWLKTYEQRPSLKANYLRFQNLNKCYGGAIYVMPKRQLNAAGCICCYM